MLPFGPTRSLGLKWSLIAGTLGAIRALGVLLAFGKMPFPICAGHHVDHLCRSPDGQRGGQHHQGERVGFR